MKAINDRKYQRNANNENTNLSIKKNYGKDRDSVYEMERAIIFYLRILSLKEVLQFKVSLLNGVDFS